MATASRVLRARLANDAHQPNPKSRYSLRDYAREILVKKLLAIGPASCDHRPARRGNIP